ncbi:MAG: DUF1552 domain-containing protein [Bryobacterales bacterium]|nr:DUF1552 domain-containing protein [Bryobacterales bacterium]
MITKRMRLSRRAFLRGVTAMQAPVLVGLPPLVSMFNSTGTAYAKDAAPAESRFVFWYNGNGIPERYWIPAETGSEFQLSACLKPLARSRDDIHVITGLDNAAGRGGTHPHSTSGILTCMQWTGRGAGGPSLDYVVAGKIGNESRFRSLQIGVSQESYGDSMRRNMTWSAADRPLPPEEIPHKMFDRLFGVHEDGWVKRKRSILDTVRQDAAALQKKLPKEDSLRVEEHLTGVRDLERAITALPEQYHFHMEPPDFDGDMRDWPRVAKIQSDLLAYAFATRQTRVASYMLTKCQGIARFPWLGYTAARHHDYTHRDGLAPGADGAAGQRILRDICRWHVEEFAYLLAKLKSIPEGDSNLLDRTLLVFVHEHAEANPHKNTNCPIIVAGHRGKLKTGLHSSMQGTVGELYLTLTDDVLGLGLGSFAKVHGKLSGITV